MNTPNTDIILAAQVIEGVYKAFYSGTGYSGVHDPDYDVPPDAAEWHREGLEQLKRRRVALVDGNRVRAEVQESSGGEPVIRLYDVASFNSQDALRAWLSKAGAKLVGERRYILPADIEGDFTWPSR